MVGVLSYHTYHGTVPVVVHKTSLSVMFVFFLHIHRNRRRESVEETKKGYSEIFLKEKTV